MTHADTRFRRLRRTVRKILTADDETATRVTHHLVARRGDGFLDAAEHDVREALAALKRRNPKLFKPSQTIPPLPLRARAAHAFARLVARVGGL